MKAKVMRKQTPTEKQLAIECRELYDYLCKNKHLIKTPFLSCSANWDIVYYNAEKWLVLKSYDEIASAHLIGTGIVLNFGRFSTTSYQHQDKFLRQVREFYTHDFGTQSYWLDYIDWYN